MGEPLDFDAVLDPGMQVFVSGSSNEPVGLLEQLASTPDAAAGVTFTQFPLPGLNRTDLSVWMVSDEGFLTPVVRQLELTEEALLASLFLGRGARTWGTGHHFIIVTA